MRTGLEGKGESGTWQDARDQDGTPVLFGWLLDLPRIAGFLKMLTFRNLSGKIICFDFQRDVLENYCVSIGAALEFETIDFKKFERRFFGD